MSTSFDSDFPPYPYLMQVLNHCPGSAVTYIELWRKKNKDNKYKICKNEIQEEFLVAPTKFRNNLFAIAREGLINVDEKRDVEDKTWWILDIELVGFDHEYDKAM